MVDADTTWDLWKERDEVMNGYIQLPARELIQLIDLAVTGVGKIRDVRLALEKQKSRFDKLFGQDLEGVYLVQYRARIKELASMRTTLVAMEDHMAWLSFEDLRTLKSWGRAVDE